jgi:prolyl 4-hydroxylase
MSDDFSRALDAARLGTFSRARKLFERAAFEGNVQAEVELGVIAIQGLAGDVDVLAATEHFDRAARLNNAQGHYWLALLALVDPAPQLSSSFFSHFAQAVAGNYPYALCALGVATNNAAALSRAAALGDKLSAALVEPMKGAMSFQPDKLISDLEQQLAQRPALPRAELGKPVRVLDGVLSELQTRLLIEIARPSLQPALVRDPKTGQVLRSPLRSNSATVIEHNRAHLAIRFIERSLVQCSEIGLLHAESLGLLHYAPNEEYKPHRDYLHDPALIGPDTAGQRARTIFCYLNEPVLGGETEFLHWNQRISPKRGRVVVFDNMKNNKVDPDSVHAGLPVLAGEKWLATLWLRERQFRKW